MSIKFGKIHYSVNLRSIHKLKNLAGKKILLRVDFNVPMEKGQIKSDYKLIKTLPTIDFLKRNDAKIIIVSHLGRPKTPDKKHSLKPIAERLEKIYDHIVPLLKISSPADWKKVEKTLNEHGNGSIVMLENIRFVKEEEKDDKKFAKKLAGLADYFVLDGFAVSHRAASSVSGVAKIIPAYAGLLLADEYEILSKVIRHPKRPLTVILGGAKAETKVPVINNLLNVANYILIGGGVFNTYLAGQRKKIGASLHSKEFIGEVKKFCKNKKIILPVDVVVGKPDGKLAHVVAVENLEIPRGMAILDIGPASVRLFSKYIKKSQTLLWNGALGMFEQKPYHHGTFALARLFAARSKGKAFGVCGGGETVEILEKLKIMDDVDLVSTGGGAMLEFLSGKKLPGIENLIS